MNLMLTRDELDTEMVLIHNTDKPDKTLLCAVHDSSFSASIAKALDDSYAVTGDNGIICKLEVSS